MRRLKLFSAVLGFLLAIAGVALESRPLVWTAMVVLAVALGLRFWLRRRDATGASDSRSAARSPDA